MPQCGYMCFYSFWCTELLYLNVYLFSSDLFKETSVLNTGIWDRFIWNYQIILFTIVVFYVSFSIILSCVLCQLSLQCSDNKVAFQICFFLVVPKTKCNSTNRSLAVSSLIRLKHIAVLLAQGIGWHLRPQDAKCE